MVGEVPIYSKHLSHPLPSGQTMCGLLYLSPSPHLFLTHILQVCGILAILLFFRALHYGSFVFPFWLLAFSKKSRKSKICIFPHNFSTGACCFSTPMICSAFFGVSRARVNLILNKSHARSKKVMLCNTFVKATVEHK